MPQTKIPLTEKTTNKQIFIQISPSVKKTVWLSWLLIVDAESICSAILCPESPAIHQKGNCVWRYALVCPRHHRITESPSLVSALSALGPESLLTSSTNCFEVNSPQFMNLHKLFLQPRSIQLIFMEPWEIVFLRKKLEKLAFNRWCQNLACGTSTWTMNKRLNLWVGNTFVWALIYTSNTPLATLRANSHTLFTRFLLVLLLDKQSAKWNMFLIYR